MKIIPREKAKELIRRHYDWVDSEYEAKQSSLITVDEILAYHTSLFDAGLKNVHMSLESPVKQYSDILNPLRKYWNEVKEEINKL